MTLVLQKERERQSISRSRLAGRAEMSAATVGQIEAGRLIPYESQLRKLSAVLREGGWEGGPEELAHEVGDDA